MFCAFLLLCFALLCFVLRCVEFGEFWRVFVCMFGMIVLYYRFFVISFLFFYLSLHLFIFCLPVVLYFVFFVLICLAFKFSYVFVLSGICLLLFLVRNLKFKAFRSSPPPCSFCTSA